MRQPHVRPVTRAARYRWAETHPGEPRWREAIGIVAIVALAFVLLWILPVMVP
jgi:hypothetical protein